MWKLTYTVRVQLHDYYSNTVTVEHPNKGHFGIGVSVLYSEVVLCSGELRTGSSKIKINDV